MGDKDVDGPGSSDPVPDAKLEGHYELRYTPDFPDCKSTGEGKIDRDRIKATRETSGSPTSGSAEVPVPPMKDQV